MKLINLYIYRDTKGVLRSNAEIDVPPLGQVKIDTVISDKLMREIEDEALTVMGIKLRSNNLKSE